MCTVTYIPLQNNISLIRKADNKIDFLLTSNRDESTARPSAYMPDIFHLKNRKIAMPIDPLGKGTWIALEEFGKTICLLNGAFEPHLVQMPYRHSRGIVVSSYFNFKNINDFVENYNFKNLEPFTLVIVENGNLFETRWDGSDIHLKELDVTKPYIWSSATLYSNETRKFREELFSTWLAENDQTLQFNHDLILEFHQFKNDNEVTKSIEINRNNTLRTVSITSIKKIGETASLQYKDLINDQNETIRFGIQAFREAV